MQALIAFLTISALCVGHIYLRFASQDMKLQHRQLQEQARVLQTEINRLDNENAALCDSGRLRDFGSRDLRMVEDPITQRQLAVVPAGLAQKYTSTDPNDRMIASADENLLQDHQSTVKKVLLSLADTSKAFASMVQK
jgi:cell division protein FtsL